MLVFNFKFTLVIFYFRAHSGTKWPQGAAVDQFILCLHGHTIGKQEVKNIIFWQQNKTQTWIDADCVGVTSEIK